MALTQLVLQLHVYAVQSRFGYGEAVLLLLCSYHFPGQDLCILDIALFGELLDLCFGLGGSLFDLAHLSVERALLGPQL